MHIFGCVTNDFQLYQLILYRIVTPAIGNHLLRNQKCAPHFKRHSIFHSKAQSDFHLSVLESIFIALCKPNWCRQKEFAYKHKLFVRV